MRFFYYPRDPSYESKEKLRELTSDIFKRKIQNTILIRRTLNLQDTRSSAAADEFRPPRSPQTERDMQPAALGEGRYVRTWIRKFHASIKDTATALGCSTDSVIDWLHLANFLDKNILLYLNQDQGRSLSPKRR